MSNTTVNVYREDLAWLKRAQIEMSATKGEIMPMAEVVHVMVETIQKAKEEALNG